MLTKVGDAFAFTYRRGEVLTPTQKAGVFIEAMRNQVKQIVRDAVRSQAAATAAAASDSEIDVGSDGA